MKNACRWLLWIWPPIILGAYYHHSWPHFDPALPLFPTAWPSAQAIGRITQYVFLFVSFQAVILLVGRVLQKRSPWRRSSVLANLLIGYGLGMGFMMGALFLLGVTGLYSPSMLILLFLLISMGAVAANRDLMDVQGMTSRIRFPSMTLTEKAFSVLIAAYMIVFLFHTLTPEMSNDALVYHLGFPNLWLMEHRLRLPLTYFYSAMPLNTELLYGLALSLSDDVLAKLIHFGFGVASLGAIYLIVRERASRAAALLSVVIFLAPPMVALDFMTAASDLPVVFFGLMAGYAMVQGVSGKLDDQRWVLLAGLFCGLGIGCKYTAGTVLLALMAAWLWQTRRVRGSLMLALAALVAASPWYLKNLILFHNPIYPFLHTMLPSPNSHVADWNALQLQGGSRSVAALLTWRGLADYITLPWAATMGRVWGGNYVGPALLAVVPVLLTWPKATVISLWRKLTLLEGFMITLAAYVPRYWLPAIAFLAVLIGLSANSLPTRRYKAWVTGLILVVGGLNVFWIHRYNMRLEGWKVTFGQISRADYLKTSHLNYESPYYAAAAFINQHLPQDAKILLLGEPRSYYLQRLWVGASFFDVHPFFAWADEAAGGDQLYERLQTEGLSWILFNPAEAALRRQFWVGEVTPHGRQVLDEFWSKHIRLVFNDQSIDKNEARADAVLAVVPALPPHVAAPPNVLGKILRLS